jgi:iron complex outermembrane recepter protein
MMVKNSLSRIALATNAALFACHFSVHAQTTPTTPTKPANTVTPATAPATPTAPSADKPIDKPVTKAAAAAGATDVEQVFVTARRVAERLRDIPTSATVIDETASLDRGGLTDVQALLAEAPAVRFLNTSSPVSSEISIRGSGTSRGTNADPSVGIYRDGLYVGGGGLGGRSFSRLDLFDTTRVEVLRGPQGALFGRNAVGGAINVITARPDENFGGWVDLNYGFDIARKQLRAALNVPITDKISTRFGVDIIDQDKGFFFNPDNNVYFDRNKTKGGRGQIRYKGDRLDVNLLLETQRGEIPAVTFQVFILPNPTFPRGYIQPEYSYPWNFPPAAGQDLNSTILQSSYKFDSATLNAAATFRDRTSFFQFDADALNLVDLARLRAEGGAATTDPNATTRTDDRTKSFTANVFLSGVKTGRLSWLVGGETLNQTSDLVGTTGRSPTPANPAIGFRSPSNIEYKSQAIYGSLGFDVLPNLNATLDIRKTWDDKVFMSNRFDRTTGLQAGGAQFIVNASQKPTNLAYTGTLGWKASNDILVYARIGSGYRSGAFNTNLGDSRAPKIVPPTYDNEDSISYEIGVKGNITRQIYVTATSYRTRIKGFLAQDDNGCFASNPRCPVAATPFLVNAGEARIEGAELELSGRFNVGPGTLRANGSISRQTGSVTAGPFSGTPVPQMPETIASASFTYRMPFIADTTLVSRLTYQTQVGGFRDFGLPTQIARRELVDARIAIQRDDWTFAIYANNALDAQYQLFGTPTTRRLNEPRLYGVQLRREF